MFHLEDYNPTENHPIVGRLLLLFILTILGSWGAFINWWTKSPTVEDVKSGELKEDAQYIASIVVIFLFIAIVYISFINFHSKI